MSRHKRLAVTLVALAGGAVLPAMASADAASAAPAASTSASVKPATVEYWSDDELAVALHEPRAAVSGRGGSSNPMEALAYAQAAATRAGGIYRPSSVPVEPPDAKWYTIASQTKDWAGTDLPTRYGDYSNFGYNKIVTVHHMSDPAVIEAPYHGTVDVKSGTNWTYYGVVTVNGYPKTSLTSVASLSRTSRYGATPDNRWVGTITAYCNNASTQACPDYIP